MKNKLSLVFLFISTFIIASFVFVSTGEANAISTVKGTCSCDRAFLSGKITCTGCDSKDIKSKCASGIISNISYTCTKNISSPPKAGKSADVEYACTQAGGDLVIKSGKYNVSYSATCTETTQTDYVLSIDRDGGSLGSSDFKYSSDAGIGSYTFSKKASSDSVKINLPTTGSKNGFNFGGIYTGSKCTGTKLGSTITISSKENYKKYYACWVDTSQNNTTTKKKTTKTTTRKVQQSVAPVIEVPVQNTIQTTINDYRFVGDYENVTFQGSTVSCGDIVKVTTCDESVGSSSTCNIESINGVKVSGTKVYRQKLREGEPTCSSIKRYTQTGATYFTDPNDIDKSSRAKTLPCGAELNFVKSPTSACAYGKIINNSVDSYAREYCEVKYEQSIIYVDRNKMTYSKPVCFEEVVEERDENQNIIPQYIPQSCKPSRAIKNETSAEEQKLAICYTYENGRFKVDGEDKRSIFSCASGYRRTINLDLENNTCNRLKNSKEKQTCYETYIYSCKSISKPRVHGTGSLATADGYGTISIKGYDSKTNSGLRGYVINNGSKPTIDTDWKYFQNTEYEEFVSKASGTYFVWTITHDQSISYPIMLTIDDDDISTTVNEITLSDPNTEEVIPFTPIQDENVAYTDGVRSSDYVRLSNRLTNNSPIATGFNLFTTAYELTVDSDKIALYANLTSEDANYVPGFEPRTVNLDYGRNVVLIKIINNKGKERTYTFIINRNDNRESVNALKTLTTSIGNLNFDPYISDYTISVPKNAKSVNINGTLESINSAFVKGYEPRKINLLEDITSAVLRTISEAGITRNYVLTFIKTGADISTDITKSAYLNSLTIPGTELNFDKDILSYTVSIPYEVENIPVFALAESENATVEINGNMGLKVGTNHIEIIVTNDSITKIYSIFITRKEDGLEVSSNTKLETLTAKDYNILFYEDVYDYTIKIKREKSLQLTATPQSSRSQVYMYGNNDLTAFSTIRVKVIAENGDTGLYSVDIIKDVNNKELETTIIIIGSIIILGSGIIITINKRRKKLKDYIEG